jgi:glycosyltransferase involved in cell wall biosynthesis
LKGGDKTGRHVCIRSPSQESAIHRPKEQTTTAANVDSCRGGENARTIEEPDRHSPLALVSTCCNGAAMSFLVNVTIPVFNEEACLAGSIQRVVTFLNGSYRSCFEIVIADNASTDRTYAVARDMARQYACVRVLHLDTKGRGLALRTSWMESDADIVSYMDVDLSTDLDCFPRLIDPLLSGAADFCVGSRLLRQSLTTRGLKREIVSRVYNRLVKVLFHTTFSDAQCGFKALTRKAAMDLLPFVEDNSWFFDTELLLWAERKRYRIDDLPVRWKDDPDSRVKILQTAFEDIRGLLRVRHAFRVDDASKSRFVKRATKRDIEMSS